MAKPKAKGKAAATAAADKARADLQASLTPAEPAAAPAELAPDQVGDALLAGQLPSPAPETQVPVVVSDGSIQTVSARDLGSALDQGWTVATSQQIADHRARQKYESAGAQARTALEAGARGLTLGLSDAGLNALGVNMADVEQRQVRNPGLALGSEVLGAALPVLLSGGGAAPAEGAGLGATALRTAGAATRAVGVLPRAVAGLGAAAGEGTAALLGEGILARGAALGVQGAVEGGLYGVGQAVSESAIKDAPLTAERVLAHAGMGALFGGGGGAVLGTAAAAAEHAIAPTLKRIFTVENVERFVDEHGLRQWAQGRGKSMFKQLRRDFGDDAATQVGRVVRDEGLDAALTEGATWQEMHAVTKQKLARAGQEIGDTMRAIDAAKPGSAGEAVDRIAARASSELLEPLAKSGIRGDGALAKKIRREFEWLWPDETIKAGQKAGVAPSEAMVREQFVPSFEQLHQLRARIDDLAFTRGGSDPTPYQKVLQNLRGIVEDELTAAADKAAEQSGQALSSTYSAAKQRYRVLKWLDGAAENNAASDLANRQVSLTDSIAGSAIGAATLGRVLSGDVSALGGIVMATMTGAAAGMANRYLRTMGQQLVARTGEKVLSIMRASERAAAETDSAVRSFFAAKPVTSLRLASTAAGESLADKFDARRAKLERFAQAPEQHLRTFLGDTPQTAPGVASAVQETATRAHAFLQSKLPARKTRESDIYAHMDERRREPDSAMARFNRYFDAVENPRAVIADFSKGRATREGVEALRAVYPQTHQHLVEQVQQQLATGDRKKLPYSKLVQLSLLLGKPLHPSLEPRFIAACQSVHRQQRAQQQEQAGITPGNRKAPEGAEQLATASQQLEAPP